MQPAAAAAAAVGAASAAVGDSSAAVGAAASAYGAAAISAAAAAAAGVRERGPCGVWGVSAAICNAAAGRRSPKEFH